VSSLGLAYLSSQATDAPSSLLEDAAPVEDAAEQVQVPMPSEDMPISDLPELEATEESGDLPALEEEDPAGDQE
jgi:hypothetical protein